MLRSSSGSRKLVTGFNEHRHGDMWLVLMSVWFNIRSDHCRASLTCWLTSWAQCTLDRQKGEELKVQRPPSCGISHLGIDLGVVEGWLRNVKQVKGVCRVHFTVKKPPPSGIIHVCLFTCPAVCRWCLTQFLNWRCKWAPEVCFGLLFEALTVLLCSAFVRQF